MKSYFLLLRLNLRNLLAGFRGAMPQTVICPSVGR